MRWRRVSEVRPGRRKRSGGVWHVRRRRKLRRALVAFGEKPKRIDLVNEVGDAGPSTEPEPDYQDPYYYKHVYGIRPDPPSHVFRRLLHRILSFKI